MWHIYNIMNRNIDMIPDEDDEQADPEQDDHYQAQQEVHAPDGPLDPESPHPHAGMLFADFLLSPEGQELIKQRNRVPASRAVKTKLNDFPYEMIDPVITLDEDAKWEKIWSELFLKGQKLKKESD